MLAPWRTQRLYQGPSSLHRGFTKSPSISGFVKLLEALQSNQRLRFSKRLEEPGLRTPIYADARKFKSFFSSQLSTHWPSTYLGQPPRAPSSATWFSFFPHDDIKFKYWAKDLARQPSGCMSIRKYPPGNLTVSPHPSPSLSLTSLHPYPIPTIRPPLPTTTPFPPNTIRSRIFGHSERRIANWSVCPSDSTLL